MQERLMGAIIEAGFRKYILGLPFIKIYMTSAHLIKCLERYLIIPSEQGADHGLPKHGVGE